MTRKSIRRMNPLVVLGVGILLATGTTALLASAPSRSLLAQSTMPAAIGLGLIAYGRSLEREAFEGFERTIVVWTGAGLVVFFVVGFWFGQVSRFFETSFAMAIVASLGTGSTFGAVVGVYSARLKRTNAALERRNAQMDRFASVVSHDLRNPLTVAHGRLELAAEECESEHLADVRWAIERSQSLVDDVLALAREGEQIDETSLEPVDLPRVARAAWNGVDTADATLRLETETRILADRSRLRQLLENLFRNGVEHGGSDATITVGDLEEGAGFYVEDDGSGLGDADHDRLLESGYSTSSDGTGFGLSIVQAIATGHEWTVEATDGRAGGLRIEFGSVTRQN